MNRMKQLIDNLAKITDIFHPVIRNSFNKNIYTVNLIVKRSKRIKDETRPYLDVTKREKSLI
jgi:hypothetical protein